MAHFAAAAPVATSPAGRICAEPGCHTRLSIYNHGPYCVLHEPEPRIAVNRMRHRKPKRKPVAPGATKVCTLCHEEKPASLLYFPPHPQGKYGLHSRCRPCHSHVSRAAARKRINPPKYDGTGKTCCHCGATKPRTPEYWKSDSHCRDGIYTVCRSCIRKRERNRTLTVQSPSRTMHLEVSS